MYSVQADSSLIYIWINLDLKTVTTFPRPQNNSVKQRNTNFKLIIYLVVLLEEET
jgi:hypothetical protein